MALNNAINLLGGLPVSVAMGGTGAATFTANGILLGNGTSAIAATSALTDGQLLIGSTGNAPSVATLTAGSGVTITNGSGTITIAASNQNPWTEVTGTTQAMAVNNSYVANNAALVTLTLPATAAFGDRFVITGKGAGLFKIAQNASQTINFGSLTTTAGTGGSITATHRYDTIEIVCITANTQFNVVDSIGNFDVV
jgi:hypothetical protein